MAASDFLNKHQSGKYVMIHRGLRGLHHSDVDFSKPLGIHWSDNEHEHVAHTFASDSLGGDSDYPEEQKGTVLHAIVHQRHILDYEKDADEWEQWASSGDRIAPGEGEVPLRPDTPVYVIGATDHFHDRDEVLHKLKPKHGWL